MFFFKKYFIFLLTFQYSPDDGNTWRWSSSSRSMKCCFALGVVEIVKHLRAVIGVMQNVSTWESVCCWTAFLEMTAFSKTPKSIWPTPTQSNAIHCSGPTATVIPFEAYNVHFLLRQVQKVLTELCIMIFSLHYTPLHWKLNPMAPYHIHYLCCCLQLTENKVGVGGQKYTLQDYTTQYQTVTQSQQKNIHHNFYRICCRYYRIE